ncbi:putative secreted protein [Helicobacter fennelliae]|uniref:Putative secreted protein n=1 Tax=Helicobacter fennelliae TaxID=215 RepID=A0A2X3DEZ7_9HELI|nr:conjugal transfer protein TraF [Helicobacter fennelliae]SQB98059.1 putative secreted protein [Helicobacter fennelliae]
MTKKFLITLIVSLKCVFGLEFGGMGNVSAGMGGAGVALKNSPFALYYNPALLSAENSVRFGYSVGVGLREKNIDRIANIDFGNFASSAERFIGTLAGATGGGSGGATGVVASEFGKILNKALTTSGATTGNTLEQKLESVKNGSVDVNTLIANIKQETQNSTALDSASKDLINNVAGNMDFGNISVDAKGNISGITLSFGGDAGMDQAVRDFQTLQDVLKENALSITSQNGVAFQFAPALFRGTLGTFGVGFFSSVYASTSIKTDPNRMDLILKNGSNYYKVNLDSGGFGYSQTTQTDYEEHSLAHALELGNVHSVVARTFWINEIPIGYAHTFYLKNVNLNFGISMRLMSASNAMSDIWLSTSTNIGDSAKKFATNQPFETKTAIAVDLGTMVEIDLPNFQYLTFGFVAKNINTPTFRYANSEIQIKPQYRIGMAYNRSFFALAFDADLSKNDMLSDSFQRPYSQMIGGGAKFDIKVVDLRLGLMKDIRQDDGLILTGGLNILGFLDLAIQAGTALGEAQGYRFPRYLNIRLGGNFSF